MGLTIGEVFDLLFAPDSPATDADRTRYPNFDDRRWFRKPAPAFPSGPTLRRTPDLQLADNLLRARVLKEARKWHRTAFEAKSDSEASLDPDTSGAVRSPLLDGAAKEILFDPIRHVPPRMPYDVFAVAAYLMDAAGIYHHLQPTKAACGADDDPPTHSSMHLQITADDRKTVVLTAKAWASLKSASSSMKDFAGKLTGGDVWTSLEPLFESWWILFAASARDEILQTESRSPDGGPPVWWKHCWRLMAIADEAARRTGFRFDLAKMRSAASGRKAEGLRWFEFDVMLEHVQRALAKVGPLPGVEEPGDEVEEFPDIESLSIARRSIVNVLPKVRTSAVGCTLRSLSHHLALLPPAGIARGRWTPNYARPTPASGSIPNNTMNILLVPMPYSLRATSFRAASIEDVKGVEGDPVPQFGYFDVDQHWLTEKPGRPAEIVAFFSALLESAQQQAGQVHGVVFPELALDYPTFVLLRDHISKFLPEADLFIGGVSSDKSGKKGNFVAVVSFQDIAENGRRYFRQTVRGKHHRWKLERSQLRDYGLLGVLSPELSWWENIELQDRLVDFTAMREDSVFAAMICEDLARVDPCQQVIRAVGPSLVIALLMDAPQLAARWPARYATVLAEDPGCAVLTLTSRGLMTRQHRLGIFRASGDDRVVGLWRDDRNEEPKTLKCPYDAQAVLLTIVAETATDVSLDGRVDKDAKAWRYVGSVPVRLPRAKEQFAVILGEEDLACW